MDKLIAFCGLDCATCEGFQATQANDDAWKERVAAAWRTEYNHAAIDSAYVTCDGCTSTTGQLGGHCAECDLRSCAVEHGLINCGHCPDYQSCEKIQGFVKFSPAAKVTLDTIFGGLGD